MTAILRSRRTLVPLAAAAAAGAILLPAAIPASAASGFATQVVSESQALVGSATNTVVTSAASLIAETPTLLRTLPLSDTASIVAAPNRALLGPALAAASDPTADLIAALQSAITKLGTALSDAPRNLTITAGQLLDGNVRAALQTFSNILIQPIVLIGLLDLPNIASASSQLNPFLAPVFNALPNIAINIVVTALQLFTNAREGVATIYEGIRDGLKAGDIGAAGAAITTGISNILAQGSTDLFGENGVIAALKQSGDDFLNAISQLGKPAPTVTNTLRATSNAAVAPSTTPATEASAPAETTSTTSKAADTTSTVTAPATTAPETTTSTPGTSTPEATTPSTSGTAPAESTSTASTPVAAESGTAAAASGTATSGDAAAGSTASATSSESTAPAASKAGASAPAASASTSH